MARISREVPVRPWFIYLTDQLAPTSELPRLDSRSARDLNRARCVEHSPVLRARISCQYRFTVVEGEAYCCARTIVAALCDVVQRLLLLLSRLLATLLLSVWSLLLLIHPNEALEDSCRWTLLVDCILDATRDGWRSRRSLTVRSREPGF